VNNLSFAGPVGLASIKKSKSHWANKVLIQKGCVANLTLMKQRRHPRYPHAGQPLLEGNEKLRTNTSIPPIRGECKPADPGPVIVENAACRPYNLAINFGNNGWITPSHSGNNFSNRKDWFFIIDPALFPNTDCSVKVSIDKISDHPGSHNQCYPLARIICRGKCLGNDTQKFQGNKPP
jgi:hypothetical protein